MLDESQDRVIEKIPILIRGLHPALEGLTIAQMSDIHLRPYTRPSLLKRAVAMANQMKPDLIVLIGDFVWRVRDDAYEIAPILALLNARYEFIP